MPRRDGDESPARFPLKSEQGALDSLVARALSLLEVGDEADRGGDRVERVAESLLASDLGRLAEVDIGIWGRAAYRASARTAAQVHRVAVSGDDVADE